MAQSTISRDASSELQSPSARRLGRPRWLDPRLLVGALLVLASVALGAKIVSAADDTVPVLVAADDLQAGMTVHGDDVRQQGVRLASVGDRYVRAGQLPAGYILTRPVAEGELVPRSALAAPAAAAADTRQLTVNVDDTQVPEGFSRGTVVDIWLTPAASARDTKPAERLLGGAVVLAYKAAGGGLGGGSDHKATLLLNRGDRTAEDFDKVVSVLLTGARDDLLYFVVVPRAGQ